MDAVTRIVVEGRASLRRGAVVVKVAVMLPVLGAFTAIGIDISHLHNAKTDLQRAADAAAVAAAGTLGTADPRKRLYLCHASAQDAADHNPVDGSTVQLGEDDVVLGSADFEGATGRYTWRGPGGSIMNAVQVILRREEGSPSGPVPMTFGRMIGMSEANLSATSRAVLVPRDIAISIDLSGSMNDDSELRHYRQFTSDTGGERPGVQINLYNVWAALPMSKGRNGILNGPDPVAPPNPPGGGNTQPGNGGGMPSAAGGDPATNSPAGVNPLSGPRWGWMTGFGAFPTLGSYSPVGDAGLYNIPLGSTTTDADVIANLTESGYWAPERTALLSSANDGTATYYRNRVKVMLGLCGWKSGKALKKYTTGGNGDNRVDDNEVVNLAGWPFAAGSWDEYIGYMGAASAMRDTDGNFRYRYGIKTIVNYLLEKHAKHTECPELAACPERPIGSVKDAIHVLINMLVDLGTQDHCSLEVFAQTGRHEINLTNPVDPADLPGLLQTIPATLDQRQAGHYDAITNIGAGIQMGYAELTSQRARPAAAKVLLLLTDGKPNCDSNGNYVGDMANSAVSWCRDRATAAKHEGITIYTIGVGGDVYAPLLRDDLATAPDMYYFADSTPDENGVPLYVSQLQTIFQTLGGRRPVRLIR